MKQTSSKKDLLNLHLWDFITSAQNNDIEEAEEIRQSIQNLMNNSGSDDNIKDILFNHPELIKNFPNSKHRNSFIEIIFLDEMIITDELIKELEEHIQTSFEGESLDLNKLYRYNMADSKLINSYFSEDSLSSFISNHSESVLHEAQSVICFYLETFNVSRTDLDKMKLKSKNDDEFIIEMFKKINNACLLEDPFLIKEDNFNKKISFKKRASGVPDVLFYNNSNNQFSLGFATRDQGTTIEGNSIIRHPVIMAGLINSLIDNNMDIQYTKSKLTETKQKKSIQRIQQNLSYLYKDDYPELFTTAYPKVIETLYKKLGKKDNQTISKLYESIFQDTDDKNWTTALKKFENHGIKFKTYYLGKISSPAKTTDKIGKYTPEEFLSLLINESYKSGFSYGAGDLKTNPKMVKDIVDSMNNRYKTINQKNSQIIRIDIINSEKESFKKTYIPDFFISSNNIGNNFKFSEKHLDNMLIIDSKIMTDINYKINDVISKHRDNPTNYSKLNIDNIINNYFLESFDIKTEIGLDGIKLILEDKYKTKLEKPEYKSIQQSFDHIKSNKENIEMFKKMINQSNQNISKIKSRKN